MRCCIALFSFDKCTCRPSPPHQPAVAAEYHNPIHMLYATPINFFLTLPSVSSPSNHVLRLRSCSASLTRSPAHGCPCQAPDPYHESRSSQFSSGAAHDAGLPAPREIAKSSKTLGLETIPSLHARLLSERHFNVHCTNPPIVHQFKWARKRKREASPLGFS